MQFVRIFEYYINICLRFCIYLMHLVNLWICCTYLLVCVHVMMFAFVHISLYICWYVLRSWVMYIRVTVCLLFSIFVIQFVDILYIYIYIYMVWYSLISSLALSVSLSFSLNIYLSQLARGGSYLASFSLSWMWVGDCHGPFPHHDWMRICVVCNSMWTTNVNERTTWGFVV